MKYDDEGNLEYVTTSDLSEDVNSYENGNLIQTVTGSRGTFTYTYDETYEHRLTSVSNGKITQNMSYDGVGNVTGTTLSGEEGKSIVTAATYDDFGNRLLSLTDATGASVTYVYGNNDSIMMGLPTSVTAPNGTVTTSVYDENYRVTETGIAETATLLYTYSNGYLNSVRRTDSENDSQTYNFTYDSFGNMAKAAVGNRTLASYTYGANNGLLTKQTYGNDDVVAFTYDDLGRLSQRVLSNSSSTILTEEYTYRDTDNNNTTTQVAEKRITAGDLEITTSYEYDLSGNITSATETIRNLTNDTSNVNVTSYEYDDQNQLVRENNQAAGKTWTWEYDTVGNILNRKEYAYTAEALGSVVDTVIYVYGNDEWQDLLTSYDGNAITYDNIGNPLNDGKHTYTWQNGRQLASMESLQSDETVEFSYDASGLRTKKTVIRGAGDTHTHSYSSTVIAPTCTEGGYTLHACECGESYQDTETAARGHFFATSTSVCSRCGASQHEHSYTSTVVAPTCTENGYTLHACECGDSYQDTETAARGHYYPTASSTVCTRCGAIREVEATASVYALDTPTTTVIEYNYIYSGSALVEMDISTVIDDGTPIPDILTFTYDSNGYPATVTSNGVTYYYVTNLQGDVTSILNASGSVVVQYAYDAWGGILSTTGSLASTLGETNPLRYRGYVYDSESGLYYLQSRYYDSVTGRFLNADVLASTGQGLAGFNMFAYCANFPVCFKDTSGCSIETALDIASLIDSLYSFIKNPSWFSAGYLAWDAAAVITPFLPGAYVSKGGKFVAKVAGKVDDFAAGSNLLTGSYNALKRLSKGIQHVEVHHLIEKRFRSLFKGSTGEYLSVLLSDDMHQTITNRWRNLHKINDIFENFAYGSNYRKITFDLMEQAVNEVYKDMPAVLDDVLEWMKKNWKVT